MLSLAQAALFGIGAYTSALLTTKLSASYAIAAVASAALSAVASLVVSLLAARLRGDYFALATFAFQVVIVGILNNFVSLTQGPFGIAGIPPPTFFHWRIDTNGEFMVLAGTVALLSFTIVTRLSSGPFGRALHAIRGDEVFAQSLGKETFRLKLIACAVAASIAGLAGSVYAHFLTYIDPTSFTLSESILILSMVIIGGAGSFLGPLIGAAALVALPEVLRFVGIPTAAAASMRQLIYGLSLVLMMLLRPNGLVGRYRFGREHGIQPGNEPNYRKEAT